MAKTSHELARELLALPDLPVWIYENGDKPVGHAPTAKHIEGYTLDGDDHEVIELFGKSPVVAEVEAAT